MRITWRRVAAFLFLFLAMNRTLAQFWGEGLNHWVIDVGTVRPAAWLARQIEGGDSILADGSRLRAPDASLNILYGCEGSDVLMLLIAAMLAAPLPWRGRLGGILAGSLLVFALNQARVLALFYTLRARSIWFGEVHGLVGPLLIVVVVTIFYLAWLRRSQFGGAAR